MTKVLTFGAAVVLRSCVVALSVVPAHAQAFTVLHTFTGGGDGASPETGLTFDAAGNLYGTTYSGESSDCPGGVVFELTHRYGLWTLTTLYTFNGACNYNQDGAGPTSRVLFAPDSTLFGTTRFGGNPGCGCGAGPQLDCGGCGTAHQLRPSPIACPSVQCPWRETQLYVFGYQAGEGPSGEIAFDTAQRVYGSTLFGGNAGLGVVYQLTHAGMWTENVLDQFSDDGNGDGPNGVIFDNAGNLYGTTGEGGLTSCNSPYGCGAVFKLAPANGSWTETVLHSFSGGSDGAYPSAGLTFDDLGNLYGTTTAYGANGSGTVFELSPSSGGTWNYSVLYSFTGPDNCGPSADLAFRDGSLYGTTNCDGADSEGSVFKLTLSNGGWTYTSLHDFTGGSDGANPISNVVFDSAGNLYGTTALGGLAGCGNGGGGCGVVWEITP